MSSRFLFGSTMVEIVSGTLLALAPVGHVSWAAGSSFLAAGLSLACCVWSVLSTRHKQAVLSFEEWLSQT